MTALTTDTAAKPDKIKKRGVGAEETCKLPTCARVAAARRPG
ncbi:MAG: hypothetical protein WDM76_02870 [Limisphaerales bacterium]